MHLLPISLSTTSAAPYYQQIVEQVRNLIYTGRLPAGAPMPSVRILAQQLVVSVITTRRAYEELEREGLIYTRPGMGSFVSDVRPEELKAVRMEHVRTLLRQSLAEAAKAGLTVEQTQQIVSELLNQEWR